MSDVSIELYAKIVETFERLTAADTELIALADRAADYRDVDRYAKLLGEYLAQAFRENLSSEVLPDGKMYYNIAEKTIKPMIEDNRKLVNLIATKAQTALNEAAGIGIKAITPKPNVTRVKDMIQRIADEPYFDDIAWMLDAPVRNITQSFADDCVKANADFQAKAGLSPKISRIVTSPCCKWCSELAGTYPYDYGEMPEDIFRRHENCDCLVLYEPGDGRKQNVHTKRWADPEDAAKLEARIRTEKNYVESEQKKRAILREIEKS